MKLEDARQLGAGGSLGGLGGGLLYCWMTTVNSLHLPLERLGESGGMTTIALCAALGVAISHAFPSKDVRLKSKLVKLDQDLKLGRIALPEAEQRLSRLLVRYGKSEEEARALLGTGQRQREQLEAELKAEEVEKARLENMERRQKLRLPLTGDIRALAVNQPAANLPVPVPPPRPVLKRVTGRLTSVLRRGRR